jgi:hypothetical protein
MANTSTKKRGNCKDRFTRQSCNVVIPYCQWHDNPYQNGGTCCSLRGVAHDDLDTPTTPPACVSCAPEWKSDQHHRFCNQPIPYCEWNDTPCGHGSCVSKEQEDFICQCTSGWVGANCKARDLCLYPDTIDCGSQGTCHSGTCACTDGYTGPSCQNASDPCDYPQPRNSDCGSHGTCNSGTCACSGGYDGSRCQIAPDLCEYPKHVECGYHGSCKSNNGSCVCHPPDRYYGTICDEEKPWPCCGGGRRNQLVMCQVPGGSNFVHHWC